jgi:TPR repeat protein
VYYKLRVLLGLLLLVGAFFGTLGAFEETYGYIEDDGNWLKGSLHILYVTAFLYIGVIGFKLIRNKTDVIRQTKWIFLLQTMVFNIPNVFAWIWTTGFNFNIVYIQSFGLATNFAIFDQLGPYFDSPFNDFTIGINVTAIIFAWLVCKVAKHPEQTVTARIVEMDTEQQPSLQNKNNANLTQPKTASEEHYVQAYEELQLQTQEIATWAKALAASNGNQDLAESIYLRLRVEALLTNHTHKANAEALPPEVQKHEASKSTILSSLPFSKIVLKNIIAFVIGIMVGGLIYAVFSELEENSFKFINNYKVGAAVSLVTMLVLVILGIPLGMIMRRLKLVSWVNALSIILLLCSSMSIYLGLLDRHGNIGSTLNGYATATHWATFFSCCMVYVYWVGLPVYGVGANSNQPTRHAKSILGLTGLCSVLLILFYSNLSETQNSEAANVDLTTLTETTDERIEAAKQKLDVLSAIESAMDCRKHYNNESYSQALAPCRLAAEGGDRESQYAFGLMFAKGRGVDEDFKKAAEWVEKAAEQGHANAQNYIGMMYKDGEGVTQSNQKAIEWVSKAAEQGEAIAQNNLGVIYSNGELVNQDYNKAAEWIRKSANQGYATAQFELGYMYQEGQGVEQSDVIAFEWYLKAANQGDADAQNEMGIICFRGRGTEKDESKAVEWLRKAADQGHASAKKSLTNMGY